jgi:hypothetical protein
MAIHLPRLMKKETKPRIEKTKRIKGTHILWYWKMINNAETNIKTPPRVVPELMNQLSPTRTSSLCKEPKNGFNSIRE